MLWAFLCADEGPITLTQCKFAAARDLTMVNSALGGDITALETLLQHPKFSAMLKIFQELVYNAQVDVQTFIRFCRLGFTNSQIETPSSTDAPHPVVQRLMHAEGFFFPNPTRADFAGSTCLVFKGMYRSGGKDKPIVVKTPHLNVVDRSAASVEVLTGAMKFQQGCAQLFSLVKGQSHQTYVNATDLLEQLSREISQEVDLYREARNLIKLKEIFDSCPESEISVPEIIKIDQDALVTRFIEGTTIFDALLDERILRSIAPFMMKFTLIPLIKEGILGSDGNPGNGVFKVDGDGIKFIGFDCASMKNVRKTEALAALHFIETQTRDSFRQFFSSSNAEVELREYCRASNGDFEEKVDLLYSAAINFIGHLANNSVTSFATTFQDNKTEYIRILGKGVFLPPALAPYFRIFDMWRGLFRFCPPMNYHTEIVKIRVAYATSHSVPTGVVVTPAAAGGGDMFTAIPTRGGPVGYSPRGHEESFEREAARAIPRVIRENLAIEAAIDQFIRAGSIETAHFTREQLGHGIDYINVRYPEHRLYVEVKAILQSRIDELTRLPVSNLVRR